MFTWPMTDEGSVLETCLKTVTFCAILLNATIVMQNLHTSALMNRFWSLSDIECSACQTVSI